MGVDWPLYEKLLGNGIVTNRRAVAIQEAVNAFLMGMVDDPAYQENAVVDGEVTPIIASRKSEIICEIKAAPSTDIHIGDMIECFEEHWIVVSLYIDKVGIINGEMWLCNDTIRFQNRSIAVISRHCVIDDGTYSKKSSDPNAYVMTNTYKIYITIDNATRRLFVDKRLAFGQIFSADGDAVLEVYKIIGMDVKSKNFGKGSHLMVLTVQRDVYNPQSDSLDENICDIFIANGDKSNPQTAGSCVIVGRDIARLGTSRKYTAVFTEANGNSAEINSPIWTVLAPDGIKHTSSGCECVLNIPLDEKFVGEFVTITVSDPDGLFGNYEKKVQVITVG